MYIQLEEFANAASVEESHHIEEEEEVDTCPFQRICRLYN